MKGEIHFTTLKYIIDYRKYINQMYELLDQMTEEPYRLI